MNTFRIPVIADKLITNIDVQDYGALAIPSGFEEYDIYDDGFSEPLLVG